MNFSWFPKAILGIIAVIALMHVLPDLMAAIAMAVPVGLWFVIIAAIAAAVALKLAGMQKHRCQHCGRRCRCSKR